MDALPEEGPLYWAPEVFYWNGVFYLYYSTGDEEYMHLRVATADHPAGPFTDRGLRLTAEKFAIDAHVFTDSDGSRFMFYAADFLDRSRVGTGTVVDRMLDPFTLAQQPKPVTLAHYDWQIFDPQRLWKGGVCWHTLEGPFVLKHNDRYYQMFSGGNYQNDTYGVGYAVAESVDQDGEWEQCCDGVKTPPVLRTLPEAGVFGPGHNSVVRGPDNRTLFCVYHRWQKESGERVMAIDRLDWEGERLVVHGPSTTPQPIALPDASGFDGITALKGSISLAGGEANLRPGEDGQALATQPVQGNFIAEVSLRMQALRPGGACGLSLEGEAGQILRAGWRLDGESGAQGFVEAGPAVQRFPLPEFDPLAVHLLRVETQGDRLAFILDGDILHDGARLRWHGRAGGHANRLGLFANEVSAFFSGFAVTTLP